MNVYLSEADRGLITLALDICETDFADSSSFDVAHLERLRDKLAVLPKPKKEPLKTKGPRP